MWGGSTRREGRQSAPPAPDHRATVPGDLRWLPPSAGPAGTAAASGLAARPREPPAPAPLLAAEKEGGTRCVAFRGMLPLLRVNLWCLCYYGGG